MVLFLWPGPHNPRFWRWPPHTPGREYERGAEEHADCPISGGGGENCLDDEDNANVLDGRLDNDWCVGDSSDGYDLVGGR